MAQVEIKTIIETASKVSKDLGALIAKYVGDSDLVSKMPLDEAELLADLNNVIANLGRQVNFLRKDVFGSDSERMFDRFDPNLFGDELEEEDKEYIMTISEDCERAKEEARAKRKKGDGKHGRRNVSDFIPKDTPTEVQDIYPKGTCDAEGKLKPEYSEISVEETKFLDFIPGTFVLKVIRRHKVKEVNQADDTRTSILMPALPLEYSGKLMAGPSLLAHIIVEKFKYADPFHRQLQRFMEPGIRIPPSTIDGWFKTAIDRLDPLYDLIFDKLITSDYIMVDESTLRVLGPGTAERHKAKKGYMFAALAPHVHAAVFSWIDGSRSEKAADSLLERFSGAMITDGCPIYDYVCTSAKSDGRTVVHSCDWAHPRRKVYECLKSNYAVARPLLSLIDTLFVLEQSYVDRELTFDQIKEERQKKSKRIVDMIFKYIDAQSGTVLPKSPMGKAMAYIQKRKQGLYVFLEDGRYQISSNLVENVQRPGTVNKKNFIFAGSNHGAVRIGKATTFVETCKCNNVDPRKWLEDVLKQILYYQAEGRDLSELLPWNWIKSHPDAVLYQNLEKDTYLAVVSHE